MLKNRLQYQPQIMPYAHSSGSDTVLAGGQTRLMQDVQIHLGWLNKQIKEPGRRINDPIDRHPDLKRDVELLCSISGIGDTTVTKVLA